jgi:hypothetical protein
MNEIKKAKYRMSEIMYYINKRKIWSYYAEKRIPMAQMKYEERIENKSYNKAIEKLDKLAQKIIILNKEYELQK